MTFLYPTVQPSEISLAGKSLVVPIVSTANVSQLAVDLLISSLSFRRLGVIDPTYFIPVIGARDDGERGLTTPLEVYGRNGHDTVMLLQRSPVLKSRKQEFVDALLEFARSSKVSALLFLSGVDMSNRTDSQMMTPTYHIVSSDVKTGPLKSLLDLPISPYTSPVQQYPRPDSDTHEPEGVPFIPGGGLTRRFLSSIPANWSIPTAALLHFVLEGDNTSDAQMLAAVVCKILSIEMQDYKRPKSWDSGLFGQRHDQTLYG